MRHRICGLLLLGILAGGWAEGYHKYDYRLVRTFEVGAGEDQLGFNTQSGAMYDYYAPYGLAYVKRGEWRFVDAGNGRLVWMDEGFGFVREEPCGLLDYSYLSPAADYSLSFMYSRQSAVRIEASDGVGKSRTSVVDLRPTVRQAFAVVNEGAFFVQDQQKRWYSLPFTEQELKPVSEEGLWDPERTLRELSPGGEWRRRGFALDRAGNVMYRGIVLGQRYDVYLSVYAGLRDFYPLTTKPDLYEMERYLDEYRFSMHYEGTDSNKNSYWGLEANGAVVFDAAGNLLETLSALGYQAARGLVLHPSGDLYQFGTYVEVFVVDNVWDPEARRLWEAGIDPPTPLAEVSVGTFQIPVGLWWTAKTTAPGVRLRLKPSLDGKVLAELAQDTPLTVLEEGKEKVKVGELQAPWYMVRTWEGLQGWVYGGYLRIEP